MDVRTYDRWRKVAIDGYNSLLDDLLQNRIVLLCYDNYNGRWGDQQHLDFFLQIYAVEKAKLEARKQGYSAIEQPLADGSIKVTIQVGA